MNAKNMSPIVGFKNNLKVSFKIGLGVLMVIIVCFVGCTTKPRPDRFEQGQGSDLLPIQDWDNKSFSLSTKAEIGKTSSSKASQLILSESQNKVRVYGLVAYETDAQLLKDVPFVGKSQTQYKIVYRLTDSFLKVFKIGKPEIMATSEQSYGEKNDAGELEVPMVGYPIRGYYSIEHKKDDLNQQTNILVEREVKLKNEATHFKIDFNSPSIFKAVQVSDLYPSDFFTGDWYFSETIIATKDNDKSMVGMGYQFDQKLEYATKIRFQKNPSEIRALYLNLDDKYDKSNDLNLQSVLDIPVQWKALQVVKKGNDKDMAGEENQVPRWDAREFVEVNFEGATTNLNDGRANKLVDVTLDNDYFSFTLQKSQKNIRVRYSFLRATERHYQPKPHFTNDFRKFGFFTDQKELVDNWQLVREGEVEKTFLIRRFNPNKKEIVFHFTPTSPHWLRPTGRKAVEEWSNAFEKAGTGIRIRLDDSKDAEIGDLRYNTINIVESIGSGNLFGFGPMSSDPTTGEIISVSANVHVTPIFETLVGSIRNYVRAELGQLNKKYILNPRESATDSSTEKTLVLNNSNNPSHLSRAMPSSVTPEDEKSLSFPLYQFGSGNRIVMEQMKVRSTQFKYGQEFDLGVSFKNLFQDIKQKCPEVDSYVAALKAENKNHNSDESKVLESCTKTLMPEKVLATLMHEMGHNFGLRHNFMGSVDKENFYSASETKTQEQVRSSSVMEYAAFDEGRLVTTGKYDVAAIRYGYADRVELQDGSFFKLDSAQTIEQNIKNAKLNEKQFLFCSDGDVESQWDPMCQRFDAGTTPLEIVEHLIQEYDTSVALLNNRFDRRDGLTSEALLPMRLFIFFMPLKRFYDEWRFELTELLGDRSKYLDDFTVEQYKTFLDCKLKSAGPEKMDCPKDVKPMESEERKRHFVSYGQSAERIFKFFLDLAFLPSRYCILENSEFAPVIIELETLRAQIQNDKHVSVNACSDPVALKYISESKAYKGAKLIDEAGYFFNDIKKDLSEDGKFKPYDVAGMGLERLNAFSILAARPVYTQKHIEKDLAPNFFDEPHFRAKIIDKVRDRIFNGVSYQDLSTSKITEPVHFQNFHHEKPLLKAFIPFIKQGLQIKGNEFATINQLRPFLTNVTLNLKNVPGGSAFFEYNGQFIYAQKTDQKTTEATKDPQNLAEEFIEKLNKNKLLLIASRQDLDEIKKQFEAVPTLELDQVTTVGEFMGAMSKFALPVSRYDLVVRNGIILPIVKLADVFNKITQQLQSLNPEQTEKLSQELLNLQDLGVFQTKFRYSPTDEFPKFQDKVIEFRSHAKEYEAQHDVLLGAIAPLNPSTGSH